MAAIYVVAYLSYGVPALVAGQLATVFALPATAIGYAAFLAAVALVALASRASARTSGAFIPGPGAAAPLGGVPGSGASIPDPRPLGRIRTRPARSGGLEQGEKK